MSRSFERILGTLVYAVRGGQVLMLHRHKEPNLGLWVAPGGKTEPHESPFECARRELHEETGLEAQTLVFRGLVTEVSPHEHWQWLLHIFVAPHPLGDVVGDEREGRLRWWPVEVVSSLPIPQADAIFFPEIIDLNRPFYAARMQYDDELRLIEVVRHDVVT